MLSRLKIYLKNFDWIIFAAILLLVVFSLVEIYSVALGRGSVNLLNFKKQLISAGIGFVALFVTAFIDSNFLKSLSRYFYVFFILILLAVLFFGQTINGTKGWFYFAGIGLQPVEFMKIVLILYLASYFSNLATHIKTIRHFFYSLLIALLPIILIFLQPDFGSALILGFIWLVMIFAANFNKKYFFSIALAGLILTVMAWFLFFNNIQKDRILNFLNPGANALSSGYNTTQAVIAVGSGGWIGKGVGFGSQSQLKFLPEAQTDFIFAVVAEELGFLGVMLIIVFYAIFYFRCFSNLKKINNDFGIYFVLGGIGLIFIQMFINIGMTSGIMPVVGLPLPFISYGGSSLVSLLILVGIIENIIIKSKISY